MGVAQKNASVIMDKFAAIKKRFTCTIREIFPKHFFHKIFFQKKYI